MYTLVVAIISILISNIALSLSLDDTLIHTYNNNIEILSEREISTSMGRMIDCECEHNVIEKILLTSLNLS